MKSKNENLHKAKKVKNDEFYTQMKYISDELIHYKEQLTDKVIYCNCDNPFESNFFKYFISNFNNLKLKKLISCSKHPARSEEYIIQSWAVEVNEVPIEYNDKELSTDDIKLLCEYEKNVTTILNGDGDFRSEESIDYLKQSDIVITNPPFSLFREYIAQLIEYDKKFLIVGNFNSIIYKDIFKLIKDNKLWLGNKSMMTDSLFDVSTEFAQQLLLTGKENSNYKIIDGVVKGRTQSIWFTNLDIKKNHKKLSLSEKYYGNEYKYPKYDNYNAIEVSKVKNIPIDYDGVMGVPISFLDKYNSEQFEIIKFRKGDDEKDLSINGKYPYFRILIKRK